MRLSLQTLVLGLVALLLTAPAFAQTEQPARPATDPDDVASVDSIIAALYEVISGPAGAARDWDRFRSLLLPEARLIPLFRNQEGVIGNVVWDAATYIERAGAQLEERGFFEVEVDRTTERYGNLVHAFSTYESRWKEDDPEPFQRGINSIQLLHKEDRWWIANIAWQPEWPGLPIPEQYLPASN